MQLKQTAQTLLTDVKQLLEKAAGGKVQCLLKKLAAYSLAELALISL